MPEAIKNLEFEADFWRLRQALELFTAQIFQKGGETKSFAEIPIFAAIVSQLSHIAEQKSKILHQYAFYVPIGETLVIKKLFSEVEKFVAVLLKQEND